MPHVSVIIVNYEGRDLTINCLKALNTQSFKDFEIIIVDNCSTDNSLQEVRKFKEKSVLSHHPMAIVPLNRNEGFAGGNLAGLNEAKSEYIALLNNDTEPDKDWLCNLVSGMENNPDVGICASKLIVYGTNAIDSAGDGYATSLKGYKRGEGEDRLKYDRQEYVFGACAGAALYRQKMVEEIGFFDDDFFLIHEDTDLNLRAQLAGWKVIYVPAAVVYHKVRSSIGHMSDTAVYYTLRNSEFVRIKSIPCSILLRCLPEFIIGTITEFLYFALKHRKLRLYIKAKLDVLKALPKMLRKRRAIMKKRKVSSGYLYSIMTPVWSRDFIKLKAEKFFKN